MVRGASGSERDSLVAALVVSLLKRGKLRQGVSPAICAANHGDCGLVYGRSGHGSDWLLSLAVVVVLAAHLGILSNALLPCLSAHDGPPHGARNQSTQGNQNGSGEDDVRAPGHVGDKEQDIDEKAQEADEEGDNADDEQHQQVPSRMGRAVEVGDDGENEHDESQDGCNWVHNEK